MQETSIQLGLINVDFTISKSVTIYANELIYTKVLKTKELTNKRN